MQTYHTMPTASAGKPMIGLLAAMLADDNLLSLDDTIDTWLSEDIINQIPNGSEMTLRQLLNHTSGIYNYVDNEGYLDLLIAEPDKIKIDMDFLVLALNQPAYFKPGEGNEYSNTGYLLAGLIMDQVLGMHHSIALRERIFVPLGMEATYYRGIEKDQGDFISGYHKFDDDDETYETKSFLENVSQASSPVISSVENMALFMKSVVAEQSFINDSIKNEFFGVQQLIPNNSNGGYGLGINVDPIGDNTAYYHAGLSYGYHTQNIYIKEKDLSITAFINCSTAPICESAMDSLIRKVLDNEL
ncbi:MAG: beta-lactamase family protein [Colwellia sp.]|nr:beta-lactamase family protein [Colwellia sp.]